MTVEFRFQEPPPAPAPRGGLSRCTWTRPPAENERGSAIPGGLAAEQRQALPPSALPDDWERTSRNAPCPCGSGKKFKHCHGALV